MIAEGAAMNDYLLLMHDDVPGGGPRPPAEWEAYVAKLIAAGAFEGGSSIGAGVCISKSAPPTGVTAHLSGYIRIRARDLQEARTRVIGNPVYEAGGTVEIRELPRSEQQPA
jgi:hypothetical protein